MEHSDLILAIDRQQRFDNPDRVRCSKQPADHGAMLVMRDGVTMVCCKCGDLARASLSD